MSDWKTDLSQAVTDVAELCRLLELPPEMEKSAEVAAQDYPLFVPKPFLNRIEKGNPSDPVLLQILPQQSETAAVPGFSTDPVGEMTKDASAPLHPFPIPDSRFPVLQKYAGRCLVLAANRCGIHCRFCFRRHTSSFGSSVLKGQERSVSSFSEVILSGGDPLTLDDRELQGIADYIRKFPSVKRLRIHSRLPVVLPNRITEELAELFNSPSFCTKEQAVYLILHINHPNELNEEFFERIALLKNVVLMSQTVLLKGVNDDAALLAQLFETLVNHRVIPYYLHQLDKVAGAAHFEVPVERGRQLMNDIQERLPGYAVPSYVQEIAGKPCKQRL